MLFNTLTYLIFLPIVFGLYWTARGARAKNAVIVMASCVFYGWWDVRFLALMVATCVVNFLTTRAMAAASTSASSSSVRHGGRSRTGLSPKTWLAATLVLNFGVLGVFKYFNFFAQELATLLAAVGFSADVPTLHVLLPVGISFYTFQLSGYAVDVYRQSRQPVLSRVCAEQSPAEGDEAVEEAGRGTDLLTFMAFITFFPQLVAGPIERWSNMRGQMEADRTFDYMMAREGMRLLLWGLVKKMLVADNCAGVADYIFSDYGARSLPDLWMGALAFTFQIYGDFSGYSDMAIGSARLFGIRLSRNFAMPYFATNMKDFWRRWHMTLMSWFKDYVYIPLGGNRRGRLRQQLNTVAVFLLSGLWHGANWTFVAWGLYHALWRLVPTSERSAWLWRVATFPVVVIGWVIFRSDTIAGATEYVGRMFNPALLGPTTCSRMPLALIALLLITEALMRGREHPFAFAERGVLRLQAKPLAALMLRMTVYLLVLAAVFLFGGAKAEFIYFQF